MLRSGLRRTILLSLASALLCFSWQGPVRADEKPAAKTVKMVIDYGDGVQKLFTSIAWKDKMTVLDALNVAAKHPRGIKVKYRGKGATAFLTKIDDLENEGFKRNWIYRVNAKMADRSFGAYPLKPGDTILWKFGEYR